LEFGSKSGKISQHIEAACREFDSGMYCEKEESVVAN
jgi:hypothetical protein